MSKYEPVYLKTARDKKLRAKINQARSILKSCHLCPRDCQVDRLSGETGDCETGENAKISSYNAHFGEEAPLVGLHGSGTIFFTHCSLLCNFCQNYDISHEGNGNEVSASQLASAMLVLQNSGCHNVNFVTPTHVVPQILQALDMAIDVGLNIPLVYNTSGYDNIETLQLLDGVIDIYMPDFKFWDPKVAEKTCHAPDYPEVARQAISEMHRQVGDLTTDDSGVATRGLLVRHLVLPSGMAGTDEVMKFVAEKISKNTYVNVMAQYRPCGEAHQVEVLSDSLSLPEYDQAVAETRTAGITRLDR